MFSYLFFLLILHIISCTMIHYTLHLAQQIQDKPKSLDPKKVQMAFEEQYKHLDFLSENP